MLHPTIDDDILFRFRETNNQIILVYLFIVKYPLMKFYVFVLPHIVYKLIIQIDMYMGKGQWDRPLLFNLKNHFHNNNNNKNIMLCDITML
jgi:hypothetical protein